MLNAILRTKAGNIDIDGNDTSWSTLYRSREDLLTATVFERLSYLPDGLMWELLCRSSVRSADCPALGSLTRIDYWPTYSHPAGGRVEPDAVLAFDQGVLVVEAKLEGNVQSAHQWANEWAAYFFEVSGGFRVESQNRDRVYLLAIGGFAKLDEIALKGLVSEAQGFLSAYMTQVPPIQVVALRWRDLAEAILRTDISFVDDRAQHGCRTVLQDLSAALEFHGYGSNPWVADLLTLRWIKPIEKYWIGPETIHLFGLAPSNDFRPLLRFSGLTMGYAELRRLWNER
jgi:hypothetical protein